MNASDNRVFVAWATTADGERETVGVYRTEEQASRAAHVVMSECDRVGDWGWDEATLEPFKLYQAWIEVDCERFDLGVFADCDRAVREAQDALADNLRDRGWDEEEINEAINDDEPAVDFGGSFYWGVSETSLIL